ncbi:MAG: DUF2079 domain-containing protein, partial [Candidatus Eremiobacteraeota bacterium]|nr:DUF2079 domain-containing protein [Candidatus Eremiobacteraeota bacterium]
PAAVAWLLWAIDARRFDIAAILVAVALACKEDQAPAMAFLGVAGCLYFGRRRERSGVLFSAGTVVLSAVVFVAYFAIVRPLAGVAGAWMPSHFYAWSGYAHAAPLAQQIVGRATYLIEAFLPLLFLPLRSPVVLLALPGFAEVLASREPLTYTMGQHYAAVWIPYVLVAFVLAGARVLERGPAGRRWIWTSGILCTLTLAFFSPLHLGHFLRAPNAQDAATEALIRRVPPKAVVATYDEIYAHLGFYPDAEVGFKKSPEYVIEDTAYRSARWNGVLLPQLRTAIARGDYAIDAQQSGVVLYRRTASP